MKKLLFITANDLTGVKNGGQNGSFRNLKLLEEFFDVDFVNFSRKIDRNKKNIKNNCYEMIPTKNKVEGLLANLFNYSGYLNKKNENEIMKLIKKNKYRIIFLDTSNYGRMAEKIKKIDESIIIITFFHNIEYYYVVNLKNSKKNIEKFIWNIKVKSTYYNEKKAIRYSDYLFLLNKRDELQLEQKYGKVNKINFLPVSFQERAINSFESKKGDYILFVGSYFYANYNGIKWFIENVMPKIKNKKLLIIGKNFELYKEKLERSNVKVIGTVDDLTPYYLNASCVIAPIFEGAGMKVKIAEALMYGKTIYGTQEAFEGYELDYQKVGGICNSANEFIDKIQNDSEYVYNAYSRKIFLDKYSFSTAKTNFERFLKRNKIYEREELKEE